MSDPYTDEKNAILQAALIEADFDGWSLQTLRRASDKAGVSRDIQRLAFPRGVMDLVEYYAHTLDEAMLAGLAAQDLSSMRIRDKIALAVRLRIEALAEHKPAAHHAVKFLSLPQYAGEGVKHLYRTVDAMWRAIGDTSTDFNFYTKRALLAGVFASTLMHWFDDESEGSVKTWDFLARRIDNVMEIEKAKAKVVAVVEKLPSPWSVLGKLRYPGRSRP
jgi:ubiquinone biosynthesis protein COQ9